MDEQAVVRPVLAAALSLVAAGSVHAGAIAEWPAATGACASTLQACIDGAPAGALVRIVTDTPIDEDIVLPARSLELAAGSGFEVRFRAGRSIRGDYVGPGGIDVRIHDISLVDGEVSLACSGGSASIAVQKMHLDHDAAPSDSRVVVSASGGCSLSAEIVENRVRGQPAGGDGSALIELRADGGTLNARAFHNVVENDGGIAGGSGVLVDVDAGSSGWIAVFGNRIRGAYSRAALRVYEGRDGAASTIPVLAYNNIVVCPHDSGDGIDLVAAAGTIEAQLVNNTVSGCRRGIGLLGASGGSPAARIDGVVWNNLLAVTSQGLLFSGGITPGASNDYNLIDGPAGTASFGPHTIFGINRASCGRCLA